MSRKPKYSADLKADLVMKYLASSESMKGFAKQHHIPSKTFEQWVDIWRVHGISGLITKPSNRTYSKELKQTVVTERLAGKSLQMLMDEYKLQSRSLISSWVRQYNKAKITAEEPTRKRDRSLARTTTQTERVKIAQQVIDGVYGYQEAADAYDVTYQMVYGWVRKLRAGGPEALVDRRGKAKEVAEQSAEDKLMQENRELRQRVRELEVAEALLKKFREIQRREKY
jgi:transposase-like protein